MPFFLALMSTSTLPRFIKKGKRTWSTSCNHANPKLGHVFPADINECEPTSDCMQQCTNTQGSYTCSCDQYFTQDPNNWKNCTGNFIVLFNYWRKRGLFLIFDHCQNWCLDGQTSIPVSMKILKFKQNGLKSISISRWYCCTSYIVHPPFQFV